MNPEHDWKSFGGVDARWDLHVDAEAVFSLVADGRKDNLLQCLQQSVHLKRSISTEERLLWYFATYLVIGGETSELRLGTRITV